MIHRPPGTPPGHGRSDRGPRARPAREERPPIPCHGWGRGGRCPPSCPVPAAVGGGAAGTGPRWGDVEAFRPVRTPGGVGGARAATRAGRRPPRPGSPLPPFRPVDSSTTPVTAPDSPSEAAARSPGDRSRSSSRSVGSQWRTQAVWNHAPRRLRRWDRPTTLRPRTLTSPAPTPPKQTNDDQRVHVPGPAPWTSTPVEPEPAERGGPGASRPSRRPRSRRRSTAGPRRGPRRRPTPGRPG